VYGVLAAVGSGVAAMDFMVFPWSLLLDKLALGGAVMFGRAASARADEGFLCIAVAIAAATVLGDCCDGACGAEKGHDAACAPFDGDAQAAVIGWFMSVSSASFYRTSGVFVVIIAARVIGGWWKFGCGHETVEAARQARVIKTWCCICTRSISHEGVWFIFVACAIGSRNVEVLDMATSLPFLVA
jgi:hypothetical protein